MRFHPSLPPLAFALALMSLGAGTHAVASEDAESSPGEAQGNTQEGSEALDDDALQEKYGITPGALKREEASTTEESSGEDRDDGEESANAEGAQDADDDGQAAEQDSPEEQGENSGDAVTDDTEAEEVDEGDDNTEKEESEN